MIDKWIFAKWSGADLELFRWGGSQLTFRSIWRPFPISHSASKAGQWGGGGGGLFLKKKNFHTTISLHRYILSSTAAVTLPILNSIFRIPSTLKKKSVTVSTGPSTLSWKFLLAYPILTYDFSKVSADRRKALQLKK